MGTSYKDFVFWVGFFLRDSSPKTPTLPNHQNVKTHWCQWIQSAKNIVPSSTVSLEISSAFSMVKRLRNFLMAIFELGKKKSGRPYPHNYPTQGMLELMSFLFWRVKYVSSLVKVNKNSR